MSDAFLEELARRDKAAELRGAEKMREAIYKVNCIHCKLGTVCILEDGKYIHPITGSPRYGELAYKPIVEPCHAHAIRALDSKKVLEER